MKMRLFATLVALVVSPALCAQATWPSKPVRIIVPFGAGSFTESAARVIGAELHNSLGQPFIIETKGGAGSTIGTDLVAKSAPDGYTLLLTDNSFVVSPGLYSKLPYDPAKDITQVSIVAEAPAVIMTRMELPVKSLKELVQMARDKPKTLTFGSGGQGSSAHLAVELFLSGAGIEMIHVPFKGVAPALLDLVAGRIDVGLSSVGTAGAHITAGKVRGLAVAGKERHPLLPDVPTFTEAGFPNYNMIYWFGVMAPAGTPPAIVDQLHQAIAKAVQTPKVREAFASRGAIATSNSPTEFARRVADETKVWKEVITRAGVKVE